MPMQERFDFDDEENTLKKTKLPILCCLYAD